MILRVVGSGVIIAFLVLNWMLPSLDMFERSSGEDVRVDVALTQLVVGERAPDVEFADLDGAAGANLSKLEVETVSLRSFEGERVLLVFERSADWCPFTKVRLLEMKKALEEVPDLQIIWVMAAQQIGERTWRLVEEFGLRGRVRILADDQSNVIRQLGLLKPEPELIEEGVPHPTTVLLDREGIVRFVDIRADYQHRLDPAVLLAALETVE